VVLYNNQFPPWLGRWTQRLEGCEFDSRPFLCQITTLGKCSHTYAPVTKQYKFLPVKGRLCPTAGKVTVGLTSHWPCVTDLSGLATCWLNGLVRPRLHDTTGCQTGCSTGYSLAQF